MSKLQDGKGSSPGGSPLGGTWTTTKSLPKITIPPLATMSASASTSSSPISTSSSSSPSSSSTAVAVPSSPTSSSSSSSPRSPTMHKKRSKSKIHDANSPMSQSFSGRVRPQQGFSGAKLALGRRSSDETSLDFSITPSSVPTNDTSVDVMSPRFHGSRLKLGDTTSSSPSPSSGECSPGSDSFGPSSPPPSAYHGSLPSTSNGDLMASAISLRRSESSTPTTSTSSAFSFASPPSSTTTTSPAPTFTMTTPSSLLSRGNGASEGRGRGLVPSRPGVVPKLNLSPTPEDPDTVVRDTLTSSSSSSSSSENTAALTVPPLTSSASSDAIKKNQPRVRTTSMPTPRGIIRGVKSILGGSRGGESPSSPSYLPKTSSSTGTVINDEDILSMSNDSSFDGGSVSPSTSPRGNSSSSSSSKEWMSSVVFEPQVLPSPRVRMDGPKIANKRTKSSNMLTTEFRKANTSFSSSPSSLSFSPLGSRSAASKKPPPPCFNFAEQKQMGVDLSLHMPTTMRARWLSLSCKGTPPGGRMHHTSNVVGLQMFVYGGTNEDSVKNQMFVLDLVTATWKQLRCSGSLPCPRYGHSATTVGDQIYVFGGKSKEEVLNDLYVFHVPTETWFTIFPQSSSPPPRSYHSSSFFDNKLYIFGGLLADRTTANDCWVYNLGDSSWTQIKVKSLLGRAMGTATPIFNSNQVIMVGGFIRQTGIFSHTANYSRKLLDINFDSKCIVKHKSLSFFDSKTTNHGASAFGNLIVMFGGRDKSLLPNNSTVVLDPSNIENSSILTVNGEPPPPLHGHTFVRNDHNLIVFGGRDNSGLFSSECYILELNPIATNHETLARNSRFLSVDHRDIQHIAFTEIAMGEKIASGATGAVYKGIYKSEEVVVKKYFYHDEQSFQVEVNILGRLCHPNIVKFIGAVTEDTENLCVVLECIEQGDLFNYFQNHPEKLERDLMIAMALDTAKGIKYLHDNNILHRDLKSTNLLVSSVDPTKVTIKLMDFGDSQEMRKTKLKRKVSEDNRVGTTRWTAPEVLRGEDYTPQADVYSFGVILWELQTQQLPYTDIKRDYLVEDAVLAGSRPELPLGCLPGFVNLIHGCWNERPSVRPTIDDIIAVLEELKLRYSASSASSSAPASTSASATSSSSSSPVLDGSSSASAIGSATVTAIPSEPSPLLLRHNGNGSAVSGSPSTGSLSTTTTPKRDDLLFEFET